MSLKPMIKVLSGVTIVEFAGIGPGPFCGMMLADHGARVIQIDRPGSPDLQGRDVLTRGRERYELDLKTAEGLAQAMVFVQQADAVFEGFRPGVMEKLGLGPDVLLQEKQSLVYARMTGWGQYGPLSPTAGHDINYIAVSGNLHGYGRAGDKPTPPINAVGDFAGGGMMLAFGILAGILHARETGQGQVIDCAMTDGAALIHAMQWGFTNLGMWEDERGTNLLDTGAYFYDTYRCSDGKFIALGAIEPQFYAEMRKRLGLSEDREFDVQMDKSHWPRLRSRLAELIITKPRDYWIAASDGSDACVSPVLSMAEALEHPHNRARGTFIDTGSGPQPAPAPRFSYLAQR